MFYYAQLDENNICIGVSQLSGEVDAENMILLTEYNVSLAGKKYNNETWEEVEQPTLLLSTTEQAMLQMSVSMEYMAAMMEFNSNGGMTNVS